MQSRVLGIGSSVLLVAFSLGCGNKKTGGELAGADKTSDRAAASGQPVDDNPFVCPEVKVEFCGQTFLAQSVRDPDRPLTPFDTEGMPTLSVSCHDRNVTDLRPLACLPELRSILLNNLQTADLRPLAKLENLLSVTLYTMPVTDLSPLAGNSELENFDLLNLPLSDISVVSRFSRLQNLTLNRLPVTDLSALTGLEELVRVRLDGLPARDLRPLAGHPKLKSLTLYYMDLPDLSPLTALPLERLDLGTSTIQDLRPIGALASLKELYIGSTKLPAGQLEELRAQQPSLLVHGTTETRNEAALELLYPKRD